MMSVPNQFANLPALTEVINRLPITVLPETLLVDAIFLMSQAPGRHCALPNVNLSIHTSLQGQIHSSCVLVMDGFRLVGILTERDVVKLASAETGLSALRVADAMTRQVITMTLSASATTLSALALFHQHRIRHLPVLDDQGQLVGIVTPNNIRQVLQPMNLLRLRRVAEVMTPDVIRASRTASVLEIARQMTEHRVSCVVIAESNPALSEASMGNLPLTPVGIITERDIVQFQALELNLAQIPAQTVMSAPLFCLNPSDSLWVAHQQMQARHVQRLVVAGDRGELMGIITQTSLLQFLDPLEMAGIIETLQQEIDHRTDELVQVNRQLLAAREQLENQVEHRTAELTVANARLRQEVSDRLQAEEALRQSTMVIQDLYNNAPCGYHSIDAEGRFVGINDTELNSLGYTREEIIGKKKFTDLITTESLQTFQENFPKFMQRGWINNLEYQMIRKDGTILPVLLNATAIKDAAGNFVMSRSTINDISEAKRDEAIRRQSEQKIREQAALIDISPDAIMVRDLDCHILFWNKGAEQTYGWTAAEILGRSSCELLFNKFSPQLETALQNVLEKGEWRGEFQKVTKSGQELQISSRWKLLRNKTGQPHAILTVEIDITEQKQLEAQFLRAQRLESLGILASGIAHDMNNILAPMLASAQLLPVLNPTLDEQSRQLLTIFEDNTRRGTELVKQILAFARGLEGDRMAVQVKHILVELLQTIKSTFPKSIKIVRTFPQEDLWLVSADATQLHQVFMNFCVNARDAMPKGGTLNISAENRVLDETYVRMDLDAKVGSYVAIAFEDTGTGIAPEHIDRIFDPFFTTKAIGEGTGLGLSTVIGIVKSHGGFVTVSSKVRKGTKFQIFLPAPAVETTETSPEETQESCQGQGELILVIDDETNIRETLKLTLETQNYQVVLAANGIEAIAAYVTHQETIKVVLIDMMMPLMDGSTAIRTLQQFNPQVKIIACSGIPASDSLPKTVKVKAFLPKPFTADTLLSTLHRVLRDD